MTAAPAGPRRVLLGVSGTRELPMAVDAAVMLASGFGAALQCVVVEQEDLLSLSGLPFARAFGRAGMSAPMSPEAVARYFHRVFQAVERELVERCKPGNISWELARPQGEYLGALLAAVEEGDVVVVNRKDLHIGRGSLIAMCRTILEKAAAVVIPAARQTPHANVLALSDASMDGSAVRLARGIAAAMNRRLDVVSPASFLAGRRQAGVVVAPLQLAELAGEDSFLRNIEALGAAAVLVAGGA